MSSQHDVTGRSTKASFSQVATEHIWIVKAQILKETFKTNEHNNK
jgi:hypothetical protein